MLSSSEYETAQKLLKENRYNEALAIYERLAELGDPECQVFAGWMRHEGLGGDRDDERAFMWFEKAANLGSSAGAFYYGRLLGSTNRFVDALRWYGVSAAADYAPAAYWLGRMYVRGEGVEVDISKGVEYLERASRLGNLWAAQELSVLMISGKLGSWRVAKGLCLFPVVLVRILIELIYRGYSNRLIG